MLEVFFKIIVCETVFRLRNMQIEENSAEEIKVFGAVNKQHNWNASDLEIR